MTTERRAEVGRRRIEDAHDGKIAAFLDCVLDHYVETEFESLDKSMLPDYLQLKFCTLGEGQEALGSLENITLAFRGICMPRRTNSNAINLMFKTFFLVFLRLLLCGRKGQTKHPQQFQKIELGQSDYVSFQTK